jgi:HD-GYP domain-containing protein (c-di-GMP phosphodiesterase class II)
MDVLNKPGRLSDLEFAQVRDIQARRRHPHPGAAGRRAGGGRVPAHHEKLDGTGYPHRLMGEQISLFARMGAICDIYDAITSDRPYKAGWDPAESIRRMTQWCGTHIDEAVFRAFVKCIGIYPVGSLVRLEASAWRWSWSNRAMPCSRPWSRCSTRSARVRRCPRKSSTWRGSGARAHHRP